MTIGQVRIQFSQSFWKLSFLLLAYQKQRIEAILKSRQLLLFGEEAMCALFKSSLAPFEERLLLSGSQMKCAKKEIICQDYTTVESRYSKGRYSKESRNSKDFTADHFNTVQ